MKYHIPQEVQTITQSLERAGFEAYIVGGCVRDLLRGVKPADWDVTTNAKPDEIQQVMQKAGFKTFYENEFLTVGVVRMKESISEKDAKEAPADVIEVTTYRAEAKYTDKRHPDVVNPATTLQEDLKRRDFTINAMAAKIAANGVIEVIDRFDGQKDLQENSIRAVGSSKERFTEDALRLMRAVRFAAQLDFKIEKKTQESVKREAGLLRFIAKERIKDEFSKLLTSDKPSYGLELLWDLGLLLFIAPEIEEGFGVTQNKHHIYTVWEHNLRAVQHAAENKWSLEVRMAALLHDVAKPRTKEGEGPDSTFYNHDVVGAKMAFELLARLRYPKRFCEKVAKLVRYHLFYYNVDEVTDSSVRRLMRKVGPEDMEDLIRFMVEKLMRDPITVRMLQASGKDVMEVGGIPSGPKVGFLLNILLEEVLDDPKKNKRELLLKRIQALSVLPASELKKLADSAKQKSSALEEEQVQNIKKRHYVK